MAKLTNLARMTTATTGTGTITLGAAVSGYLTFALAGVANSDVVDYAIKDGANSEHGTGTYTSSGTTLTRTVTKSTNGNAAISLSGTAEVFISPRAETLNDASLFATGTLADARLSSNVPLKNGANTYTGSETFNTSGIVINTGNIACHVGATFDWSTANGGVYQFTTNFGAGQTIINPSLTAAPFWFVSNDLGSAGFSLHRSGAYALNCGLSTSNYFQIGGWSDGANVYRFQVGAGGDGLFPYGVGVGGVGPAQAGDVRALSTAKAWVRFNGNGGATVNASFQVSSVSRTAVGTYTVNFTTAMADTNYGFLITINSRDPGSTRFLCTPGDYTINTTSISFAILSTSNGTSVSIGGADSAQVSVALFR